MCEEIKYNEDKNFIKIWPFLDDISQAILPYSSNHLSKDKSMVVNMDFSNVRRINSSIAAITLKKVVSLFYQESILPPFKLILPNQKAQKEETNRYCEKEQITEYMQCSGFLSILDHYLDFNRYQGTLFDSANININKSVDNYIEENAFVRRTSFPIYHLIYNSEKERESVENFSKWIDETVLSVLATKKYNINISALFSVLTEIVKNSQDHTESDAFFGIDLIEYKDTTQRQGEILFSCSDLGEGIAQKVRTFLKENPQHFREDVAQHGSFTDFYKWAFTLGNSTSKKTTNKGIGMTMIIDGADILNMDLFCFDARSMMQLPKSLFNNKNSFNHEELRKRSFNAENKVGFYYYGQLKF